MFLKLGHISTLVVSSADMLREIIKNHDLVLSNRPKSTAAEIFLYGSKDVAFAPYGEYWRQARRISVLELFSLKRVQMFQYVRDEEVSKFLDKLRKSCVNGVSVNLSEMIIATSNNIVSRCILGQCFEDENGKSRFGEVSRRLMVQFMEFCVGDFFPYLKWIDVLRGFTGRLKETSKELDTFLDEVIEDHMAKGEDGSDKKDFVDIFLQLRRDDMLGFELTQDHLKAILLDMFVGGSDTTSIGLEWLMAELVKNPRVMRKVQEEVRRVVGNKPKIDMNDINQMDYLKCVIKENLRLHPSLPLLLPRETSANITVEGYEIPANTQVFINAWAIHRNPSSWERPEEFIPERFENITIDYKGQDFEFVTFGSGRRGCPGMAFAIASTEFIITNLLYWFDWKFVGDGLPEDLDMSDSYGLSVYKKIPLHLKPVPYSP